MNLDAAHYYTATGLSFDAMLKYTDQNLELLSDYDMLLMFENGVRGGLVQASMRYAKANNLKSPNFDETKEKSWLVYQDYEYNCNNLYGYAMLCNEYMPYGDFNWVAPNLDGLSELSPKSAKGRRSPKVREGPIGARPRTENTCFELMSPRTPISCKDRQL
ncbi:DNA pol B 2 domain-containing protein [Aphis craccivora]|uniref:DNA pol B 2 domain-containing protein n=1 Tax=Aphis craccivora TaxID=307492 RepID=A0A6G0VP91_APHCR|nr:DNA pol B 2 domain-containing protein [Aphis craccivora]